MRNLCVSQFAHFVAMFGTSRRAILAPLLAACLTHRQPAVASAPGLTSTQQLLEETRADKQPSEGDDSPLMRRLLQRTEENAELNAWRVRVQTEQNAYQAISGEPGIKQLVTMPDGTNGFFAQAEIASMTREGRLLCPTGMPCRVVERDTPMNQQLSIPKRLQCDDAGRNCKFRDAE